MASSKTLSDYINSNNPPHPEAIKFARSAIDDISTQIGVLMNEVEFLESERKKIRAVVSPIRVMPSELLSEFFLLAAFAEKNAARRRTVGALQRVCRRWRDVALETHGLWTEAVVSSVSHSQSGYTSPSSLSDQRPSDEEPSHEEEFKMITSWLSRAALLPKSIGYSVTRTCLCVEGNECIALSPTLDKLIKHGPLLDHISLTMPTAACFRSWVQSLVKEEESPPSSWHSLRSLKLALMDGDLQFWNDASDPTRSIFALLPTVKSLGLCLPTSAHDLPALLVRPIHIPDPILAGLTVLSVKWDWAGSSLFKLLSSCARLEILAVDLGNGEPFDTDDSTHTLSRLRVAPLVLSSLQEFYLRDGSFRILEFVRFPALSVLDMELDVDREETITASSALGSFLTSSNLVGMIKNIRLCGLIGTEGIVTLSLPVLTSLRVLELDSSWVSTYRFMNSQDERKSQQNIFPSLLRLNLLNLHYYFESLSCEMAFLRARQNSSPCLITVSYAEELRLTEARLARRLRSVGNQSLSLRMIPPSDYESERSWIQ